MTTSRQSFFEHEAAVEETPTPFQGRIPNNRSDCHRHGIRRTRLADLEHWADVMIPRSGHAHSRRWLPNNGGHRALGDVQQTRQHLLRMTAP